MYTQILLTALSMYVMPTLSGIGDSAKLRSAAYGIALKAAALTGVMAVGIYLGRDWIVAIVFTKEFGPVRDLLGFMLLGDVFQIATWPLRAALVAQNRSLSYMSVAAGAAGCQIALTYLLMAGHGLAAAPIAYCATWLAALGILALIHARRHSSASTERTR
jgi:PST family polysaccharide transporter